MNLLGVDKPIVMYISGSDIDPETDTGCVVVNPQSVRVGSILSWDNRVWDDKDEFVGEYADYLYDLALIHNEEPESSKVLEKKASQVWENNVIDCLWCYNDSLFLNKCEID